MPLPSTSYSLHWTPGERESRTFPVRPGHRPHPESPLICFASMKKGCWTCELGVPAKKAAALRLLHSHPPYEAPGLQPGHANPGALRLARMREHSWRDPMPKPRCPNPWRWGGRCTPHMFTSVPPYLICNSNIYVN